MKRAIVTYAAGAHEELLDVALPTYCEFASRHNYNLLVTRGELVESNKYIYNKDLPPAWNKIPLLLDALYCGYNEVVWLDCDLVIVDQINDFPPIGDAIHTLVRHFEKGSEVPNTGVWRVTESCIPLLKEMLKLEVFANHGWWEQAALMTLMGYCVPPEGHRFYDTQCRCVKKTVWYKACEFMRLCWNSHPNYRADHPHIVHCSYPHMEQRLEVMRALVKNPSYNYPCYTNNSENSDDSERPRD